MLFNIQIDISYGIVSLIFFASIVCVVLSYIPGISNQYSYHYLFGIGFFLLVFILGVFLTQLSWKNQNGTIKPIKYFYEGQLIDEPITKPKTQMCKIRIISAEKSICKEVANRQVIIYLPTDSLSLSIIPGDYLLFFLENWKNHRFI